MPRSVLSRPSCRFRRSGATLVDVLAGIAILAMTVALLAPLSSDARRSIARGEEARQARIVLSGIEIPTTPAGEQPLEAPAGCHLRWSSEFLPVAPGDPTQPASARLLRIRVMRADSTLAERAIPLLTRP